MLKTLLKLKLNFGPTLEPFKTPIEDYIIGVIQKILGKENKWHDKFSDYNISGMFGGDIVNGQCLYINGGYFYISSTNEEFIMTISKNLLYLTDNIFLRDMPYINYEIKTYKIHSDYDVIKSISPILLKYKEKYLTFNDDNFLNILLNQSRKKLLYKGFTEKQVNTIVFEPFHFENAKIKYSKRKNYALPASKIMLIVKGNNECRKTLYEMGIGNSTGYCFGSIEII